MGMYNKDDDSIQLGSNPGEPVVVDERGKRGVLEPGIFVHRTHAEQAIDYFCYTCPRIG